MLKGVSKLRQILVICLKFETNWLFFLFLEQNVEKTEFLRKKNVCFGHFGFLTSGVWRCLINYFVFYFYVFIFQWFFVFLIITRHFENDDKP